VVRDEKRLDCKMTEEETRLHGYLKKFMPEPVEGIPHSDPDIQATVILNIILGINRLSEFKAEKVPGIIDFLNHHKMQIEMLLGKPMEIKQ
jgi:hypothetical protein